MKFHFVLLLTILLSLSGLSVIACTSSDTKSEITNIQPGQLDELLGEREVIIIDVRTPQEWDNGRIDEALTINLHDPQFRQKVGALDPDADYLVYCRSGNRSRQASEIMKEEGLRNIFNYDGMHTRIREEYRQIQMQEE